ncbi:hypothetical protein PS2_015342 [Malus domestica]
MILRFIESCVVTLLAEFFPDPPCLELGAMTPHSEIHRTSLESAPGKTFGLAHFPQVSQPIFGPQVQPLPAELWLLISSSLRSCSMALASRAMLDDMRSSSLLT